jgi:hypothetical protein
VRHSGLKGTTFGAVARYDLEVILPEAPKTSKTVERAAWSGYLDALKVCGCGVGGERLWPGRWVQMTWYKTKPEIEGLDPGIASAGSLLQARIETFESCEGGPATLFKSQPFGFTDTGGRFPSARHRPSEWAAGSGSPAILGDN